MKMENMTIYFIKNNEFASSQPTVSRRIFYPLGRSLGCCIYPNRSTTSFLSIDNRLYAFLLSLLVIWLDSAP